MKSFLERFDDVFGTMPSYPTLIMVGVLAVATLGGLFFTRSSEAETASVVAPHLAGAPSSTSFQDVSLTGKAAIVYDLKTGKTLYEQNADAQLPLASLTKLLTMYAAAGTLSPSSPVTVTDATVNDAADASIAPGETFTFEDLARLALVASSNNAAEAIAAAARNQKSVSMASLMAGAAASAGLKQTYAVNASGLDESTSESGAYGSAHDVALLAGALLAKAPDIAKATTESSITVTSLQGVPHTLQNTNPGVVHVPNVLLSKTGYTDLAGGNLVVVFDAAFGHPIAIVVLGSTPEARFTDVNQLIGRTLEHFAGLSSSGAPEVTQAS